MAKNIYISSGTTTIKSSSSDTYHVYSSGRVIVSSGGQARVYVGDEKNSAGGYVEVLSLGAISGSVNNGGTLVVSNGGAVYNYTFFGGYANLKMGANCENGTIYSGADLYASGAHLNNTEIRSKGRLFVYTYSSGGVSSAGYAYGTDLWSGGTMFVDTKALAYWNTISAGATVHVRGSAQSSFVKGFLGVSGGGTATANYVSSGGSMHVSGGSANSNYISSGGKMSIVSGGIASATTISAGGSMNVSSGGTATATTVNSGGTMAVYGGKALGAEILGGTVYVNNGSVFGITMSTGLSGGGSLWIMSDGTASDTVMSGGRLFLLGASYKGVYKGGKVEIFTGGYSENEVFSAGEVSVLGSGSASGIVSKGTIGSGVSVEISGGRFTGTTVSNAVINMSGGYAELKNLNGAVANIKGGTFYASSGGIMSSATISGYGSSLGTMGVWSGATVKYVDVYSNGHLAIMNSGYVSSATAHSNFGSNNASISVSRGGRLGITGVYGELEIASGGSVTSAIIASGGKGTVSGTLNYALVHSGSPLLISSGGSVSSATVSSGGRINVNAGTLNSANVASKATLNINSRGTVSSATVYGSAIVNYAGKAAGVNVSSGGVLLVSGSGIARDYRLNSGIALIFSGGALLSGSINSGGRIDVYSGGTAGFCTVGTGGKLRIYSGGMLYNVNVQSGGKLTGSYNCSNFTWAAGAIADMDITSLMPGNASAFVSSLNYAKSKSAIFTLSVYATQTKGTYKLASGAAGFDQTITVKNYDTGATLGTLRVGQTVNVGGVSYGLDLDSDSVLSVTVGAAAPAAAKGDIDGNGVSDVLFQYSGGDYQLGYWMNGTNTWRGQGLAKPAEWEVLGSYDMNSNGKADSVLVGNVEVGGVKGAYIGYYLDSVDTDANWQNIGYLNNAENIAWKNKVGNLTGNAGKNSIVWYAPERFSLGAWTDGTTDWVTLSNNFGGNDWTLVGCGDFDGDGKDSVVMSYNNGQFFYKVDIGGTPVSLGSANWSGWEVRAIGDFTSDGKDDLVLFHHDTGSMVMCANGDLDSYVSIGQLAADDWFIVGAGDYADDNWDDLLVRQKSTGMLGYYSNGSTSPASWVEMGRGVDMKWTVIA